MTWRYLLATSLLTACVGGESKLGTARDNVDTTDPTCVGLTPAQLHAAAMDVYNNELFEPQSCFPGTDTTCPCGSFCSSDDAVCEVECVPTPGPGEPTCPVGKACTPSGRCADAPTTPPPALAMSIALGATATSANTTTGAVTLPIQVTTSATSVTALDDAEAATVHFSIQEYREQQLGMISDPPPVFPLIKCDANGAWVHECDLAGGWSYNVTTGAIVSQPRTISVQIPQTATPLQWMLEARSANANGTSTEVLNATPVITPATDPGHYKGTLSYANGDANHTIAVPIEAAVTSAEIAILEPSKLLFGDGYAVVARSTAKATQLGWLGASAGTYNIVLHYTDAAYDPTRGHLDANVDVLDGTGATATSLTLSLDRTGDNAACPCPSGSYCNTDLGACLPGTAAPTDQTLVASGTAASPSLTSTALATWTSLVKNAALGSSVLNGTGLTGFEAAYCYDGTAGTNFGPTTTSTVSGDVECQHNNSVQPQTTFGFVEKPVEFNDGTAGGSVFDLFQTCLQDLAAAPSGTSASTLFQPHTCASLGQFFLALAAHDPNVPMADIDQRLVMQILRQWLGVTAYVANTAVQARDYNDALSIAGLPAYQQLEKTIDQVDANLRVLLDPEVVPQYATGDNLPAVLALPDYRIRPRPLARWSFNNATTPGHDSEGNNSLIISGAAVQGSQLVAEGQASSVCRSSSKLPAGDRRYSIVLALDFNTPGGTTMVFDKKSITDYLRVDATPGGGGVGSMSLRMYDNAGRSVTFPNVPSGLIAISVDANRYTAYAASIADPTHVITIAGQSVVNNGPVWGAAGTVDLNCNLPPDPNVCTSWDRNVPNDGLDYTTHAPYDVYSGTSTWYCKTLNSKPDQSQCTGTAPSTQTCTNTANATRTTLQNQIRAIAVSPSTPPPAGPLAALTTHGSISVVSDIDGSGKGFTTETIQWRCDTTVTGYISPITGAKLVCSEPLKARYDEVSVWDRPVQLAEVADMAQRYMGVAANDSMPPVVDPAGDEQTSALPVHLLEAGAADLELLAAYARAEQAQAYGECYLGGHSATLDHLAQRGGPNLRLVGVLEDTADHLLAIGGGTAAVWYPRYAAAKQQLAARRAVAVQAILDANACLNPLGITQQTIPLFVGEDVGANATFFASSHYLAEQAQIEITNASNMLQLARNAYSSQRQQSYQLEESAATKQERIADLRANVETQLSHYCGSAQGSTSLLDSLQAGTIADNNCFIDRTLPQCAGFATATLESLPAECLRGELGNQVLAIKTSGIVMTNADATMRDTTERYDGDLEHCAQEQAAFDGDETILRDHDQEMEKLHNEQALFDTLMSGVKAGLDFANPFDALTDPEAEFHGAMDTLGLVTGFGDSQFAIKEQEKNDAYNEEVMHRSHEETLATCFHDADNEKYQIENARDQLRLAQQQLENATHQLSVEVDQVGSITSIALSQIATTTILTATPPHLHFWLDQNISDYHGHLEAARRLTYLALRALEYEAQVSLNLESATLGATVPSGLQMVLNDIETVNAPLAGQLGVTINEQTVVLSLRDEILKFAQSTSNVAGDVSLTPVQQFQRYLKANSSLYLDANGKVIGRGVRFAIAPDTWNTTICDERIWRIQPSLQIDNPPNQHSVVLYQDNTFGSQDCHAANPGAVLVSHADPSGNLLLDDTFELPTLTLPQPYVASNIDGPTGLDHNTLAAQPQSSVAAFAGRGLYSNYILLFPEPLWSDADIANVKDVLLRFDVSDVTHAPHL